MTLRLVVPIAGICCTRVVVRRVRVGRGRRVFSSRSGGVGRVRVRRVRICRCGRVVGRVRVGRGGRVVGRIRVGRGGGVLLVVRVLVRGGSVPVPIPVGGSPVAVIAPTRIRGRGVGVVPPVLQRTLPGPGYRRGEGVQREYVTEVEFLVGECGGGGGRGDFTGQAGADLLGAVFQRGREFAAVRVAGAGGQGAFGGAGGGRGGDGGAGFEPFLFTERVAVARGDLGEFQADLEEAFLEHGRPGAFEGCAGGGFERGLRKDPFQQRLQRDPDGDAGGDLGRGGGGGAGGRTDTGGHFGQGDSHFDGEDDQRRDDDELGVLDVGGAVPDFVGEGLDGFDQAVEGALAAAEFGPVRGEGLTGAAVELVDGLFDGVGGFVVEVGECGGECGPGVFDPAHGGLVAFGPVAGADHIFGDPLQRVRNLDPHPQFPFEPTRRPGLNIPMSPWTRTPALRFHRSHRL
ncbi:hypothetical protein ACFVMC_22905 [Nocardia sp. NPDC127579]|uniref:hypothetical protein n=1 Tax=Nocardia sp. NPDC127579 TaxID=3345402 RepID=UPI00364244FE